MPQQVMLTKDEVAIWTWLGSRGIANSLAGLSQMVRRELVLTSLDLKQFPAKDATNLTLAPLPPAVIVDMAGAILGIALTKIMQEQDDVRAVKTTFGTINQQITGTFLVMPTMDFLKVILRHAGAR